MIFVFLPNSASSFKIDSVFLFSGSIFPIIITNIDIIITRVTTSSFIRSILNPSGMLKNSNIVINPLGAKYISFPETFLSSSLRKIHLSINIPAVIPMAIIKLRWLMNPVRLV